MLLFQSFNWNGPFLHNRTSDWIIAGVCILLALFLAKPLASLIANLVSALIFKISHRKHKKPYADVARSAIAKFTSLVLFYIAVLRLSWPFNFVLYARPADGKSKAITLTLLDVADRFFQLFIIIQLAIVLTRTANYIFRIQIQTATETGEAEKRQLFPLMRDITKILLWTIAVFWILGSVFSVNIPALIAGLGIGGVAIALAAKESVENFFAAFVILTEKPFQTGDTIRIGGLEGSVELIGFRSTRLRHSDGSMFIVPNRTLASQNLENLSKRNQSKVQLKVTLLSNRSARDLGVLIETLEKKLGGISGIQPPVSVTLDTFAQETVDLLISYNLPLPSAGAAAEAAIKQEAALNVYALLSKYATVEAAQEPDDAESGKKLSTPPADSDTVA